MERASVGRSGSVPWVCAGVVLLLVWVAGLFLWGPPVADGGWTDLLRLRGWFWPIALLATGMPGLSLAGLLLGGRGGWRYLGAAGFGAVVVGYAFLVFLSHFQGLCLDPGDCSETWVQRLAGPGVVVASLVVGRWIQARLEPLRRGAAG